ncbi:hypothetical protein AB0F11_13765 [Streptomyces sp. NPDC032472]|uniref:hypothetical protein n=1 Tax=Streptomyces sp. NPDC032472 TaxID=3155018 RepID=UPI0033EF0533
MTASWTSKTPGRRIGIVEDTGKLLPDGRIVAPHRPTGAVASPLPLRLADAHALIGGTVGSGKTNAVTLQEAMATLANSSGTSPSA